MREKLPDDLDEEILEPQAGPPEIMWVAARAGGHARRDDGSLGTSLVDDGREDVVG